ncbi:hypothetical protein L3X38_020560 [Prunus dulcis]|uniref:Uncharacterized protein n=1 Tax=Prunus dulcis TaxID=3755 RepID=A0AAD4ZD71_PRUDU|nr:hypothetical protein L3X38_020560 [Prunus dulcis]
MIFQRRLIARSSNSFLAQAQVQCNGCQGWSSDGSKHNTYVLALEEQQRCLNFATDNECCCKGLPDLSSLLVFILGEMLSLDSITIN